MGGTWVKDKLLYRWDFSGHVDAIFGLVQIATPAFILSKENFLVFVVVVVVVVVIAQV